ncbi:MAG: GatB/YqeY domain-containing protein [bacterium]
MNLQTKVKEDLKQAMKSKDKEKVSLLRVVVGEMDRIGKNLPDELSEKVIKKMKDNADEISNEYESSILGLYLPSMLTNEQLETSISDIITKSGYNGMKDMGKVMKELKDNYGSSFDGKVASQMVRNKLT